MENKTLAGWREWTALPDLGIPALKAKLDTGARTSALHAFDIEEITQNGVKKVRFGIHPLRKRNDIEIFCVADIVGRRTVKDSGGHATKRYVIAATMLLGEIERTIEITLTKRDNMIFRMLLGRTALRDDVIVDPAQSYIFGKALRHAYKLQSRTRHIS
jgi:hypothetical protein